MKSAPLVYLVGPYRSRFGLIGRAWNIYRAWRNGRALARLGLVPVVPHMSCAFYDDLQPDEFWLDGTKELMRRCDAAFCMPEWRISEGSRGEVDEAERMGMPVLHDLTELFLWASRMKRLQMAIEQEREAIARMTAIDAFQAKRSTAVNP